jgi:hypothetical protein
MPRYYFHLVDGDQRIADERGEVLESEDLRPEILLHGLEKIRARSETLIDDWMGWSVEITDEGGRVVQVLVIS